MYPTGNIGRHDYLDDTVVNVVKHACVEYSMQVLSVFLMAHPGVGVCRPNSHRAKMDEHVLFYGREGLHCLYIQTF